MIPWNKVDIWLRGFRSIWIGTTLPDGGPHSVPIWYLWDGEHIYFASSKRTQKARNLVEQPEIVVHAGHGDDAIILEGTVIIVTDPDEWTQANNAYMEKCVDSHSGAKATRSTAAWISVKSLMKTSPSSSSTTQMMCLSREKDSQPH